MKTSKEHQRKVSRISEEMQDNYAHGKKVRIYHRTSNSTRVLSFKRNGIIDISDLNQVIKVDKSGRYAIVEPNVPMDKLVEVTLRYNLIPPVVMEFPGITVGGGIQGGAGESSSFKWGLFNNCFSEYEVVLGNGKIVRASEKENSDLFYGLAGSCGSIGIITSAKLKLIPARESVKLTYLRVSSFEDVVEVVRNQTLKKVDYIDAILFSKNNGVVMVGNLSEKTNLPQATFSNARDDWFYVHAEKITKKYKKWEELIPVKEYLFRYDRGAFWTGKNAYERVKLPFNRFTRFLFYPVFKTRRMFRLLQALKIAQQTITQDISLPKENVLELLKYIDKNLAIYPLWFCPLKPANKEFLSPIYINADQIINVGVWGKLNKDFAAILKLNRELEKKVEALGGRKVLYAQCYYPEKEFWSIYDFKKYDQLRGKYFAKQTFPDVYEKVTVKEKYKISYLGGLISMIRSPSKLPVS